DFRGGSGMPRKILATSSAVSGCGEDRSGAARKSRVKPQEAETERHWRGLRSLAELCVGFGERNAPIRRGTDRAPPLPPFILDINKCTAGNQSRTCALLPSTRVRGIIGHFLYLSKSFKVFSQSNGSRVGEVWGDCAPVYLIGITDERVGGLCWRRGARRRG